MNNTNKLLQEVIAEAKAARIPIAENIMPRVKINSRAKRFGQCKNIGGRFEIEVTKRLLFAEENVCKEVLAHEILHTCKGCMNHGNSWKRYAGIMNNTYGYNIARTASCDSLGMKPIKANYIVKCKGCGAETTRIKMSKLITHTGVYRCSKCKSKLERVK